MILVWPSNLGPLHTNLSPIHLSDELRPRGDNLRCTVSNQRILDTYIIQKLCQACPTFDVEFSGWTDLKLPFVNTCAQPLPCNYVTFEYSVLEYQSPFSHRRFKSRWSTQYPRWSGWIAVCTPLWVVTCKVGFAVCPTCVKDSQASCSSVVCQWQSRLWHHNLSRRRVDHKNCARIQRSHLPTIKRQRNTSEQSLRFWRSAERIGRTIFCVVVDNYGPIQCGGMPARCGQLNHRQVWHLPTIAVSTSFKLQIWTGILSHSV